MKFEIETENLILKVLDPSKSQMVLDFYLDNRGVFEEYEPIINEDEFYTLSRHENVLNYEFERITRLDMLRYWIFEKDHPERIIGTVSFRNIIRPIYGSCVVGYKMSKSYWRQGFCSEALNATIPLVSKELGLHRMEAFVLPDNYPSICLLEKLGFKQEGLLKDKVYLNGSWHDNYIYSYICDKN